MDSGLSIKHGLGIKCGLRTEYVKTALESKTERNGKRTSKVVPALTFPWLFKLSILPKEKEGYASTQGN